jgi:hypothetical protein
MAAKKNPAKKTGSKKALKKTADSKTKRTAKKTASKTTKRAAKGATSLPPVSKSVSMSSTDLSKLLGYARADGINRLLRKSNGTIYKKVSTRWFRIKEGSETRQGVQKMHRVKGLKREEVPKYAIEGKISPAARTKATSTGDGKRQVDQSFIRAVKLPKHSLIYSRLPQGTGDRVEYSSMDLSRLCGYTRADRINRRLIRNGGKTKIEILGDMFTIVEGPKSKPGEHKHRIHYLAKD